MLIKVKSIKPIVKAFSLVEVLVTLIISIIVVGLALTIFLQFSELLELKKKQWENNSKVLFFIKEISDDIENANTVFYIDSKLYCRLEEGEVYYSLYNGTAKRYFNDEIYDFAVSVDEVMIHKNTNRIRLVEVVQLIFDESIYSSREIYLTKKYSKIVLFQEK